MTDSIIPERLYKYKSFSVDSLDLLVSDSLYFADPKSFNDPLDCNPSIKNDITDNDSLKKILRRLIIDNQKKELEAAAAKIKYNGPKTLEKINIMGEAEAARVIGYLDDFVVLLDGLFFEQDILNFIRTNLLSNYTSGVLSLAKNYDCPLMWSHYADQHKGFCIGYDVSISHPENIYPIDYTGKRFITTQQIYDMLFGSSEKIKIAAKKEIDNVILLSKAPAWKYENEFRVISKQGLQDSPFRLSDVTFGLRFKQSAKFSVMRALQQRRGNIDFYEISLCGDSFNLKRDKIDLDNLYLKRFPESNYEQALEMYEVIKQFPDD